MGTENELNISPEEQEGYQEVDTLTFDQVRRGSEILVYVGQVAPEIKANPDYEILVTGIRKNGLLVKVKPVFRGMGGDFTARMPGALRGAHFGSGLTWEDMLKQGLGSVAEGELRVADQQIAYRLHFENVQILQTGQRSRSMTTSPIRKILFKQ